jgi:hypothetical protein
VKDSRVAIQMTGSTVPRRQLGRSLRDARLRARFTVRAAAKTLEWSEAKMWRIETGQVSMRSHDVETMCRVYGVEPDLTDALTALALETKTRGWWHSYRDVIPEWFDIFIALEGAARELRTYETVLVPGLCQTGDYARMVIGRSRVPITSEELDRRVLVRMHRQSIVTRGTDPVQLDVVLNEAVVRRPLGDRRMMAAQCRHLAELSELDNVTVRIVPDDAEMHLGMNSGPFTILRFPVTGDGKELEPATVYVDGYTGALYLDRPTEVERFDAVFADLLVTIRDETGQRSRALLLDAMREHGR